jgi:hypothetical protein
MTDGSIAQKPPIEAGDCAIEPEARAADQALGRNW